jgi:hypothetical protein
MKFKSLNLGETMIIYKLKELNFVIQGASKRDLWDVLEMCFYPPFRPYFFGFGSCSLEGQ